MPKLVLVLFILLLLLVLLRYYMGHAVEGFAGSEKSLVICKADWCGHCKKAAPEFDKLVAASPIVLKDGSKVSVKVLDADKDKTELAQYNVKGFPTVLVVDGGVTTEYPGKRTADDITEFLNQ
jgi:protein disulfide isomerase family A protein 5